MDTATERVSRQKIKYDVSMKASAPQPKSQITIKISNSHMDLMDKDLKHLTE